jgi:hypothetical protein
MPFALSFHWIEMGLSRLVAEYLGAQVYLHHEGTFENMVLVERVVLNLG